LLRVSATSLLLVLFLFTDVVGATSGDYKILSTEVLLMDHFADYRITSGFGMRGDKFHTGIDMVKAHQAPIPAFTSGTVTWAKWGSAGTGYGGYGNVVAIRDVNGYTHMYCHLDSIAVKEGQEARRGDIVGRQGNTGQSRGSHLHYEVRRAGLGTHVEPSAYLTKYFQDLRRLGDRGSDTDTSNQREGIDLPLPTCKVYLDGEFLGEGFIYQGRSLYYIRELQGKKFELDGPDYWDDASKSVYLRSV
jgi:hypothetical protein